MNSVTKLTTGAALLGSLLLCGSAFAAGGADNGSQNRNQNGKRTPPVYYAARRDREPQPGDERGRQDAVDNDRHDNDRNDNDGNDNDRNDNARHADVRNDNRGDQGDNGPGQAGQVRVRIPLAGAIINGHLAQGHAEFRAEPGRFGLRVEAEHVALPDGTQLLVTVDGMPAGMLILSGGHAELELNSPMPIAGPGDSVAVVASINGMMVTVLSGHF